MKRILIWVAVVSLMLSASMALAATAAETFTDVPDDHWAKPAIKWLTDKKIAKGRPDGTFGPNDNITRAEVAQLLSTYQTWRETGNRLEHINRGCPSCHAEIEIPGRGPLDLRLGAAVSRIKGHPQLPATATVTDCKECHKVGGMAKLMLRTVVHPIHFNSPVFVERYRGNCFTCHDINADGRIKVITKPLEVNGRGIPLESPFEADGKELRDDLKY